MQRAVLDPVPADVTTPAGRTDHARLDAMLARIKQGATAHAGDAVRLAVEFDAVSHLGSHAGIAYVHGAASPVGTFRGASCLMSPTGSVLLNLGMQLAGAEKLARRLYRGDIDEGGRPYVEHLARVAALVASDGGDECEQAAAWASPPRPAGNDTAGDDGFGASTTRRGSPAPSEPHQRHDLPLLPHVQPGEGPTDDHPLDLRRALKRGEARGGSGSFRS
jgi:hypothetical protein